MSFHVDICGKYGDADTSVHLMDGDQEVVMWTSDEWREDPSVVVVIANAIRIGYTEGPGAIRDLIGGAERLPYSVGVTETCDRLGRFKTAELAASFISTLPDHEAGIYYLDGPER